MIVNFDYSLLVDASLEELKEIYESCKLHVKMNEAALKIQYQYIQYKKNLYKKERKAQRFYKLYAIRMIQRRWRYFKQSKKEVVVQKKAASQIQKYMKGLIINRKYEEFRADMIQRHNNDYFIMMKRKLYTDS